MPSAPQGRCSCAASRWPAAAAQQRCGPQRDFPCEGTSVNGFLRRNRANSLLALLPKERQVTALYLYLHPILIPLMIP